MNTKNIFQLIACSSAFLAAPHVVSATTFTFVDYRGENPATIPTDAGGFDFNTWSGNIIGGDGYIEIGGTADSTGGFGFPNVAFPDLTSRTAELSLRLGSGNTASSFTLILQGALDIGGGQFVQNAYSISSGSLNTSTFTSILVDLDSPTFVQLNNGASSGLTLDLSNVNQWQFQGDFQGGDVNVELESILLAAVPEPHHYALGLGFIAVIATAVIRRRRSS